MWLRQIAAKGNKRERQPLLWCRGGWNVSTASRWGMRRGVLQAPLQLSFSFISTDPYISGCSGVTTYIEMASSSFWPFANTRISQTFRSFDLLFFICCCENTICHWFQIQGMRGIFDIFDISSKCKEYVGRKLKMKFMVCLLNSLQNITQYQYSKECVLTEYVQLKFKLVQ